MKNTILFIIFAITLFFATTVNGQKVIDQSLFNNTSWVLSGSYTNAGLVSSPKSSYSFSFDDNLAGNTVDSINVDFPLDITPAKTAKQGLLKVYYKYRFRRQAQETLTLQYFNVDSNKYLTLKSLEANDLTTIGNYCANISYLPTDSIFITIGDKSSAVLSGFKLRIAYNDKGIRGRGFCVSNLKIVSDTCVFTPEKKLKTTPLSTSVIFDVTALPHFYNKYTNYFVEIDTSATFKTAKSVTTANRTTVKGLTSIKEYYVRFRAVCMTGDSSAIVTEPSIKTTCAPFPLPYKEDFDSYVFPVARTSQSLANFDCVSSRNSSSAYQAFTLRKGIINATSQRYKTLPYSGNNYLYMSNTPTTPEAVLLLPSFNFEAGKNYAVRFKAHTQASFKYSVKMGISPNYKDYETSSTTTLKPTIISAEKTVHNRVNDPYKGYYESFTVPTTGVSHIAIEVKLTTGSNGSRLSLDDVEVYERTICDKPYVLKQDSIYKDILRYSWFGIPNTDGYQTDFALKGVAPGTGALVAHPSNNGVSLETKTVLTPNTEYRVYVRAVCGTGFSPWAGPLIMKTFNSCISPEEIKVTPLVGGTTAEIKFKDPDNTSSNTFQREVELNSKPFGTGRRGVFTTTNDSDYVDRLAPRKGHAYYVRKICLPGDTSKWVGPSLFKTKCDTVTLPYFEGFENVTGLDRANQESSNTTECMEVYKTRFNSYRVQYDTLSYGRRPRTGHKYVTSQRGSAWLVLPGFNLKKGEVYKLSFYWTNDGGRNAPSFSVYRGTSNAKDYQEKDRGTLIEKVDVPILPIAVSFDNSTGFNKYHKYDAYIKATVTGKEYISIKITSNHFFVSIDDISFEKVTGCSPPVIPKLTATYGDSVLITWKGLQTGATYELAYQAVGTTPHIAGSGTILTITDTFAVIKGLTPKTNYSYYVRSVCGTSKSGWTVLKNFNSGCPLYVDFWTDGFEGHPSLVGSVVETADVAPCYEITKLDGTDKALFRNTVTFDERKPRSGSTFLYFSYGNEDILHLPSIILKANTSYIYEHYYTSTGLSGFEATLSIAENDVDLATQSGTILNAGPVGSHTSGVWQKYEVEFTVSKTDTYKLGLKIKGNYNPYYYVLDDITIRKKSSCANALTDYKLSGEGSQVTVSVSNPLKTVTSPIGYEFAYRIKGASLFSGRKLANDTITTFTGLQYNTEYEFLARPICAVGDTAAYTASGGFFKTPCAEVLPYTMSFESTEADKIVCLSNNSELKWTTDETGTTSTANTGPLKAAAGSRYAYIETTTNSTRERAELITPRLTFDASKEPFLEYKYNMFGSSVDSFIVDVEVPAYSNNWVNVHSEYGDKKTQDWFSKSISIKSHLGTVDNFRVRFTAIDNTGKDLGDIGLDDIRIFATNCFEPLNVKVTEVTASSAKFTWDRISLTNNIDWQYALDTLPFTATKTDLGSFNAAVPNSLTVTPNGLRASKVYQFYLRATCANLDTSDWVGPIDFTTFCSEALPYTMSFESTESDAIQCLTSNSNLKWRTDETGTTSTVNTGPLKAATGTRYAYIETTTNSTRERAVLMTPRLTFDASKDPFLEYKYNMFGSSVDSFIVDVEVPAYSNNWVNVHSEYGDKKTQDWFSKSISIKSHLGTVANFRVRFVAIDATGKDLGDIGLDDISISYLPSCVKPIDLKVTDITASSAKFTWDRISLTNNIDWQYALDTLPFTATKTDLGSFNAAVPNSLTVTPNGLRSRRAYQFYLRATCANLDTSDWVGPINFTTPCTETLPYTMGFESTELVSIGCLTSNSKLKWTTDESGTTPTTNTGPLKAAVGNRYAYIETSTFTTRERAVLMTPQLTFDVSKIPLLNYKYNMFGTSVDSFIVDIEVPAFSDNWINVHSEYGDKVTRDWFEKNIDIKSTLGTANNFRVRFIAIDAMNENRGDIAIDAINIAYKEACPKPIDLKVTDITVSSAKVTWDRYSPTGNINWQYALDTFPFTATKTDLGSLNAAVPNALTVTPTGLRAGRDYQFYLRATCTNDTSGWVGVNFSTLCSETLPYTMGFESNETFKLKCYENNSKLKWTTDQSGSTSTSNTGPLEADPTTGTRYAYIETSFKRTRERAILITPRFTFDVSKDPVLEYKYSMFGASVDSFIVDIEVPAFSNNWVNVHSEYGDKKTQDWLTKNSNIKSNLGTADNFRVRFTAIDVGVGFKGDIALDDIALYYLSCPEPIDVKVTDVAFTSAKFTWDRLFTTSTKWEYAIDTLPFTPTVVNLGRHTGTVSNALTVTPMGLIAGKTQQFYLRGVCGSNTSRWEGPIDFTTFCFETLPYANGFEDDKDLCWLDEAGKTAGDKWLIGDRNTNHSSGTGPSGPKEGDHYLTLLLGRNTGQKQFDTISRISPTISFDRGKAPFVSYSRHMRGFNMGKLRVLVETYALSNVWKVLTEQEGDKGNVWHNDKFYFADSVDIGKTTTRFKFEASKFPNVAFSARTDMAIDNFKVEHSPATDLELSSIILGGSSCGSSRPLTLIVANKGFAPQPTGMKIPYAIQLVNGALLDTIVLTAPLDFGKTVTAMVNLTLPDGHYAITSAINYNGDADHTNDTATVKGISFHKIINTYPVVENFSDPVNSLWKLSSSSVNSSVVVTSKSNRPTVAGGPASFVDKDTALVMTNPTGGYNSPENSIIETAACLDFSSVCYPVITFDLWIETEENFDGLVLEASSNDGKEWVIIGTDKDPRWYNGSPYTTASQDPIYFFFSKENNPSWGTYSHKLDTFGGKSNVRLRFRFNSDVMASKRGIALDNIVITDGFKLPKDSLFCGNLADLTTTPIPLRVILNQPEDTVVWSTSDDIPNITVNQPGTYSVRVFEKANVNCGYADTFKLFSLVTPLTKATKDMFQDQTSCGPITLKIPEEFNEASKYTWSKGGVALSTMGEYKIATSGEYIVDVRNSCENFKDTVNVTINPLPLVEVKADHTTLIDGGTPSSTQVYSDAPNSFDHSWSHVSTKDSSFTLTTAILDQFGKLLENLITVEVTDNNGCKGRDTITITYKDNKGVNDITNNVSITVAPNPSNGIFTVGFDASNYESIRFKVLDLLGRELMVKEVKKSVGRISEKVNLTGYPEGIYLLIIATDKGFITNKLSLTR